MLRGFSAASDPTLAQISPGSATAESATCGNAKHVALPGDRCAKRGLNSPNHRIGHDLLAQRSGVHRGGIGQAPGSIDPPLGRISTCGVLISICWQDEFRAVARSGVGHKNVQTIGEIDHPRPIRQRHRACLGTRTRIRDQGVVARHDDLCVGGSGGRSPSAPRPAWRAAPRTAG